MGMSGSMNTLSFPSVDNFVLMFMTCNDILWRKMGAVIFSLDGLYTLRCDALFKGSGQSIWQNQKLMENFKVS